MAEGDHFERKLGTAWRGAYRRARNEGAPPAEVADKLIEILTRTLRDRGGVPGFEEMQDAVEKAIWDLSLQSGGAREEAAILIEAFSGLDQIVRERDGHRHTKVAAEVAKSLLVQKDALGSVDGIRPMATHLAEDTCTALVEHYFFATTRENLVAEGKIADQEQARQWQQSVERVMQPAKRQLAERLVKDPHAKVFRAPNRTVERQSTSDLLNEGLVSDKTPIPSSGVRGR